MHSASLSFHPNPNLVNTSLEERKYYIRYVFYLLTCEHCGFHYIFTKSRTNQQFTVVKLNIILSIPHHTTKLFIIDSCQVDPTTSCTPINHSQSSYILIPHQPTVHSCHECHKYHQPTHELLRLLYMV